MKKKNNNYGTDIPKHEIESLALMLLPKIQVFFASEEGQKKFSKWKLGQAAGLTPNEITVEKAIDSYHAREVK